MLEAGKKIREAALSTIEIEWKAVKNLSGSVTDDFIRVVELILKSKGRVIVTGIGKSAIIAQKIVATFNSTGTPAIFMHAADAIHGDLGIVRNDDVVMAISKSGETPEVKVLIPLLKARENKIIAMVGNTASYLAKQADFVLDSTVDKEACPNNLAPTSSTTAQLVMGDALAVSLLEMRGFSEKDFAVFHPGGTLGKRMYMRVSDLSINNEKPAVNQDALMPEVIIEISSKRLGATAVLDGDTLVGVVTDGDLRRMIEKYSDFTHLKAVEVMTNHPLSIDEDEMVVVALELMRKNNITQLPVVSDNRYVGVIHLHDILREGIL
ncbi:MAG: KpsF/GutQ family sugar-phosphate isomerase [Bacteroidales bacterium]|jgi:arabinose-5-phosphate isomerase|nr:KpsF/GutQ family sugar-phosphate isomerase [Bacteroidales bacterium]